MQNIQKEENNSEQSKKSEKMENSRPLSFPQNPQNFEEPGHENPERDGGPVSTAIALEVRQDVKMNKEENTVRIEKEKEENVKNAANCGVIENSMKIKGDLNLTINCSDVKFNLERNEKSSDIDSKMNKPYSVIWISAPTKENAVDVATLLLTEKLVSSVNILDGVITMMLKEGKIETVTEVVVKMKTETTLVPEIIKITDDHFKNKLSINDAEILSTTLKDGNLAYFRYLSENTKDSSLPCSHLREELDNNIIEHSKQLELQEHVIPKNVEVSGRHALESHT
jgi:uncharacterized protein involved in tolerance to divalent cations